MADQFCGECPKITDDKLLSRCGPNGLLLGRDAQGRALRHTECSGPQGTARLDKPAEARSNTKKKAKKKKGKKKRGRPKSKKAPARPDKPAQTAGSPTETQAQSADEGEEQLGSL